MISRPRLLLIDEDGEDRALTAVVLAGDLPTSEIVEVQDARGFLDALEGGPYDLVVTSLQTGWARGPFLLRAIVERQPRSAVVVFSAQNDRESAVEAMRAGASDYVVKSPSGYLRLARSVREALDPEGSREASSIEPSERPSADPMGELRPAATRPRKTNANAESAPVKDTADATDEILARAGMTEPDLMEALGEGESESSMREVEIAVDVMKGVLAELLDDGGSGPVRLTESGERELAERARDRREQIDETEILKLQREALLEKVARLERSNADLSEFAYIASHELQEPLRMVEKYSGLLKMDIAGTVDGPANESLGFLLDGAQRMQTLVDDLLAFSRIGNTRETVESCDCRELTDRACATLEATIDETGAEIERGKLPTVMGDAGQLTQVFVNLIGNAIRFRGDRRPRIGVTAERVDGHWQIAIRDNGIGIDAADLDHIFEIFNRLHPERGGTGIGLALCKRIVERHGGQIWAESEIGEGSTFYVALPVSESEEAARTVVRFEKGSRRRAE